MFYKSWFGRFGGLQGLPVVFLSPSINQVQISLVLLTSLGQWGNRMLRKPHGLDGTGTMTCAPLHVAEAQAAWGAEMLSA